jgi:hypothetical protein
MSVSATWESNRWTYVKDGGLNYPVAPGDVWRAGDHILACGDLEAGQGRALLKLAGREPDLIYTDPPWGAGNAASFRTKAGVPRRVDFPAFLTHLVQLTSAARRDVFMEMGFAQVHLLSAIIVRLGGQLVREWTVTYYRRHPSKLVHFRWYGEGDDPPDLNGMDDDDTPRAALQACLRPGDLVMDPCTGRGLTAATVAALGARFIGLELSPHRLSCTLTKLAGFGCRISWAGRL